MPSKSKRARKQRNNKKLSQTNWHEKIQSNYVNTHERTKPEDPVEDFVYPSSIKRQKNPIWIVREIKKVLPCHIVRYICLWCMILNESKWVKTHKKNSKKYQNILSNVITLGMNEKIDYGSEKFISLLVGNFQPLTLILENHG